MQGSSLQDQKSYNTKVEMLETQADLFKTHDQLGRFLKKTMNQSLYIKKDLNVAEKEQMLDRMMGSYPTLR